MKPASLAVPPPVADPPAALPPAVALPPPVDPGMLHAPDAQVWPDAQVLHDEPFRPHCVASVPATQRSSREQQPMHVIGVQVPRGPQLASSVATPASNSNRKAMLEVKQVRARCATLVQGCRRSVARYVRHEPFGSPSHHDRLNRTTASVPHAENSAE